MLRVLFSGNSDVNFFALFSMFLFLLFFLGVTLWAVFGNKQYMTKMANLPLEPLHYKEKTD